MSSSPETVAAAKVALRNQVQARRDALAPEIRAGLSARITSRLIDLDSFRSASSVLAYMSIGSEFDTRALLEHALAQGKTLILPRVVRGSPALALHLVRDLNRDLLPGVWGIMEPRSELPEVIQPYDLKWILVPGLAFTPKGGRLGYGAGYYDRLIARCGQKPRLVAAAFKIQIVDTMPCTAHDQNVDCIITEDETYGDLHDD